MRIIINMLVRFITEKVFDFLKQFYYSSYSLQKKITLNYIILLISPILLYSIVFSVYSNKIMEDEQNLLKKMNIQAVESIDSYISDIMQLSLQPYYNPQVISMLHNKEWEQSQQNTVLAPNVDILSKSTEVNLSIPYEDMNLLNDLTNRIVRSKKHISYSFLVDRVGNLLSYGFVSGQLIDTKTDFSGDWFNNCIKLNGSPQISAGIRMLNISPVSNDYFFSVSRALKDINGTNIMGAISIYCNNAILKEICSKLRFVTGETIVIVDENNNIIFDLNERNITYNLENIFPQIREISHYENVMSTDSIQKGGIKYLVMTTKFTNSSWKLVRVIPEVALYSNIRNIQNKVLSLILVFTFVSLIVSIFLSYGTTKPLKKLMHTMKVIEKRDLSIRFKVKYNDEIGQLGKSFNKMLDQIEDLINDVYITNIRKKEAELNALQAQINPHFIYNTLESIRMMARINHDLDTANMVSTLGSLLRYSINTKNQMTTIKEEIEHLGNYLILQNHRFENKFELELEIPEILLNIKIIKLIFQPIVENAIYHALEIIEGKGVIKIKAYEIAQGVCIDIEDNGIGMAEEQLEFLKQRANDFSAVQSDSRGVGLRNINERIKLYYGDKYGMQFFSQLGKGTLVRMAFPERDVMNHITIP